MKHLLRILSFVIVLSVASQQAYAQKPLQRDKGSKGVVPTTTGVSKDKGRKTGPKKTSVPSTNTGQANAYYETGWEYYSAGDYDNAIPYMRKAANAGSPDAMFWLGIAYSEGNGVEQSETQSYNWLKKSANAGDMYAMSLVGTCNQYGVGTPVNQKLAYEWYLRSAKAGYSDAMKYVGDCYMEEVGTSLDLDKAFYWYKKAAEAGNADGMYRLSLCYLYGAGTDIDEQEANYWYKKAASAGSDELAADQEEEGGGDSLR